MERSMRLAFRSSIRSSGSLYRLGGLRRVLSSVGRDRQAGGLSYANVCCAATLIALFAGGAWGQLPDGPGKVETERVCSQCHELARSISLRQDHAGWEATVNKMVGMGATASDAELKSITDYLAAHFAAEEMPRINVNKARAIDLESGLSLRRSESAAIIEYRTKHGPFKSIEDLKKVPNIDVAKIEAKKDRLTFEDKP
jgi:competence protein ComEA